MNNPKTIVERFGLLLLLAACSLLLLTHARGATILSGNVSGTWTPSGSPYILTADCTVETNQTLTIQPGTEVIIWPNFSLRVYGIITAIGTEGQPILVRGVTPTNFWGAISMYYTSVTNRFQHCRFSDANEALTVGATANGIVALEIKDCEFSNCSNDAIYASAEGHASGQPYEGSGTTMLDVQNCVFDSTGYGCRISVFGLCSTSTTAVVTSRIRNNIFKNVSSSAVFMDNNSCYDATNLSQIFINNTLVNCRQGIEFAYIFTPLIENNVFIQTSTAIKRQQRRDNDTGGLAVNYNCFFNNGTNFVGYPALYGIIVQTNHNGNSCDAFFNIFLDPQFLENDRYRLSSSSPCIDAGDPAIADVCFQFSRGTAISDIGAYGGPDACGWFNHGFAPAILLPPFSQSSCIGASAMFKARADGSEPLNYQWYFNTGTPLTGETSTNLTLSNLQASQAGLYSVVVSNIYGSVTSAPARLVVNDACVDVNLYAGLNISGMVGRTYAIEWVTDLNSTNWTFLTRKTLDQPRWLFIDTNTPANPWRYFRVRLEP